MAFNILASSMGFAMSVHQCKITKAKRYSLWQTPKSCCEDVSKTPTQKNTIKKASCCLNSIEHQHLHSNSATFAKVELSKVLCISTFSVSHFLNVEVLGNISAASFTLFPSNSPPIWGKYLLILIQVFRI